MVTAYNYPYSFSTFISTARVTAEQIIRLFTCDVPHSYCVTITLTESYYSVCATL